jgi:hypothetical protein
VQQGGVCCAAGYDRLCCRVGQVVEQCKQFWREGGTGFRTEWGIPCNRVGQVVQQDGTGCAAGCNVLYGRVIKTEFRR